MTDEQTQFYEQFNTVVAQWAEWQQSPEGLAEIIRDPWKGQAPAVYIDMPGDDSIESILRRLQERHQ